jgi:predicted nucleotidyltransferase
MLVARFDMNIQQIDRQKFLDHLHAVEAEFPIHFVGTLPRGTAAHVRDEEAIDLLAETGEGLSLLSLVKAETELSKRLGRAVGIVLLGGLRGDYGERVKASARPL